MEKTAKKRIKKRHIVLCVLIFLLLAGYVTFVATRYSSYSTYVPFSGRFFDIDSGQVEAIRIKNGTTGYMMDLEEDTELQEMTGYLNELRYYSWLPNIPIGKTGYTYWIWLDLGEEKLSCEIAGGAILLKGVWYFVKDDGLEKLTGMVDLPIEEMPTGA